MYNLKIKHIVIRRDIDVDENAYWEWENDEVQRSTKSTEIAPDKLEHTTNEDGNQIAESDSAILKRKSLAEVYEKLQFCCE